MTISSRDWQNDFDDPEFHASYNDILRNLATKCPVARSSAGEGYWAVMSYKAVTEVARNTETFQSGPGFIINRPDGIPPMIPIEMETHGTGPGAWRSIPTSVRAKSGSGKT